ncbi:MAG: hypothetical protein ABIP94_19490 [Planctomycetota bacterium]
MIRRFLTCAAFCSLGAFSLAAQSALEQAVADLANAERRDHATRVLDAAGPASVLPLRAALLRIPIDSAPDAEHVIAMLQALSRRKKDATPAIDAVEHVYEQWCQIPVREQAACALARIATASGDEAACESAQDLLMRCSIHVTSALYSFAWNRLQLGPQPSSVAMRTMLRQGSVPAAVAASAAADQPELDESLTEALEEALGLAVARPPQPWLRCTLFDAAAGELAAALWQHGSRGPHVARGLLRHPDPDLRHTGLAALADATELSVEERIDVLSRLWDESRHVRDQALANLQGYGRGGLLALRALRAFEREPSNSTDAEPYARAALGLVRSAGIDASEAASALLRDADHILSAHPWPREGPRADANACLLLADIVIGCRGAVDDTLANLAELAVARGAFAGPAGDRLLAAFVSSLGAGSEEGWRAAVRALAMIGPTALHDAPSLASTLLASRTLFDDRIDADSAFVAEAAILLGRGASDADVSQLQGDRRWHVALRALVESMRRRLPQDEKVLRTLLTVDFEPITAMLGPVFAVATRTSNRAVQQPEHAEPVHLVAALALASKNEQPWTDPVIAQAFAEQWSIDTADVGKTMQDAIATGRLLALAQQVEAKIRRRLLWSDAP